MTVLKCIIDRMEIRTIYEQLRLKLCKNIRTTRLGQNLLVLIKKKAGIISKKLRVLLVAKSQRILTISLTIKF